MDIISEDQDKVQSRLHIGTYLHDKLAVRQTDSILPPYVANVLHFVTVPGAAAAATAVCTF